MNSENNWAGIEFCETTSLTASPLNVETLATGWSNQLGRKLDIDLLSSEVLPLPVECLSIRLQSKLPAQFMIVAAMMPVTSMTLRSISGMALAALSDLKSRQREFST